MNFLKNIFSRLHTTSNSAKVAEKLNSGEEIFWKPESDRYTYDNQFDTNYDKDWKPETPQEKETLAPEGYHRVKDRKAVKEKLISGMIDSALRKSVKENPDLLFSQHMDKANEEANDLFNNQYHEKQISIPSTALSSIHYDPNTNALEVQFTSSNKKYFYPEVPPELVEALLKAPSKGEFFMENIHDQYTLNPGHRPEGNKGKSKELSEIKRVSKSINKRKWGK